MATRSITISQRFLAVGGHPTGFDYLRIVLALGVIVWHSFGLSYGPAYANFVLTTLPGELVLAIVPMFFALSGFLVAGSLERNSISAFISLRALRIIPALAVEVCLSALVLGPFLTTLPLAQYFVDTKFFEYFLNIVADIHYLLPGMFHSNPFPDTVNGQLWTVPVESKCYLMLAGLAVFGVAKRRYLFLVASVVLCSWLWRGHFRWLFEPNEVSSGSSFLFGVALFQFREVIKLDWRVAALSFAAMATCFMVPQCVYFAGLPTAYLTVYVGMMNLPRTCLIKGADYSYGLYLYGFVIQQTIANLFPRSHQWYCNLALAIPVTALLAAFSWTFVESPALKLRDRLPQATPTAATVSV